jgi:hypothetical protein
MPKPAKPKPPGEGQEEDLARLASAFGAAYRTLEAAVGTVEAEIAAVRAKHFDDLVAAVAATESARAGLEAAVDARRDLFVRPRTRTVDGVRYGVTLQRGGIHYDSDAAVVARIEALMPDRAGLLIATTKVPVKTALADLHETELKRLGVERRGDTDKVVVKMVAGDAEKLAAALVGERK